MRIAALLALALLAGCGNAATTAPTDGKIPVVTSFSTLNSFVEAVGGSRVSVQNLVPIGASPENYQPTPQDVAALSQAQLLVVNGAGIEAWLGKTLSNAQNAKLHTIVCTDGLPVRIGNPHLWMDPEYAKLYVAKVRDGLIALDPPHAAEYRTNALAYDTKLDELSASIRKQIATIPPAQRNMIVFHNAWLYYNVRFGIKTVGVIEINPGQDPNPQQIARLVDLAKRYHVRAVFSEPEYSAKLAQSLAASAGIRVVSDLYDDSVGQNAKAHDYLSMMQYDTGTIVAALK
ncbi:MAG: metal ABC transporter substrate-binding protein [Candidatus Eremiobacteraeota bacterium]|nr:metal ABC transporter substrate-binding protein [Candidatus Eremiobacteraeota bacterium]